MYITVSFLYQMGHTNFLLRKAPHTAGAPRSCTRPGLFNFREPDPSCPSLGFTLRSPEFQSFFTLFLLLLSRHLLLIFFCWVFIGAGIAYALSLLFTCNAIGLLINISSHMQIMMGGDIPFNNSSLFALSLRPRNVPTDNSCFTLMYWIVLRLHSLYK